MNKLQQLENELNEKIDEYNNRHVIIKGEQKTYCEHCNNNLQNKSRLQGIQEAKKIILEMINFWEDKNYGYNIKEEKIKELKSMIEGDKDAIQ